MEDKRIQNIRPNLTDYLKEAHFNDIRQENTYISVDLTNVYREAVNGIEIVEFIEEDPKEGLSLLEECYADAFYCYKNEKPHVVCTIYNLPPQINKTKEGKVHEIEDIKVNRYRKLMEVKGIIVLSTKIKMALKRAAYICTSCGDKKVVDIENPHEVHLEPVCSKCGQNMMFVDEEEEGTMYTDFQELKIQQPLDTMSDPEAPPKYVSVFLEHSEGFYTGQVQVSGIITKTQKNKKIPLFDLVYKGIHCKPVDEKLESDFDEAEIEDFKKISQIPDVVGVLSELMFHEIKGHEEVKKAIFLQQIKGVRKGTKRPDSHILLITDPGTGKSVMLRKLALIPGNVYGSANMATGVGLTASVVQESTEIGDSTWVVKPGLLVRANRGTACIDEFTTMKSLDTVLEAMESQTIHINKGGINAKLPSECAILAACNPRWGRYDPNISIGEQINVPSPILSRFDLIFPIKDEPNPIKDKAIAEHIIKVHRSYLGTNKNAAITLASKEIEGINVDFSFITKYIAYARTKTPAIHEEAEQMLTNFYLSMRKGTVQITARQLEAAIRIAESIAKAKLKDQVDEDDAREAIELMSESLKEIAYDPETGQFDVDKIAGVSKSDQNRLKTVYEIIKEVQSQNEYELAHYDEVLEEVKARLKIEEPQLEEVLKKLIKNGDIDEPKTGKYKVI